MKTIKLTLLALTLLFLFAPASHAQAIRFDTVSQTTSNECAIGSLCPLLAIPGTTVQVCVAPGCSSTATTYTSSAATTPCAPTSQITLPGSANPTTCVASSDAQGNLGFWVLPGNYNYYLTLPFQAGGGTYGPYPFNATSGGGGGGTVTTFGISGPSWLAWNVTNPTATPFATATPATGQTSHQFIGTCGSATTFTPCSILPADMPTLNQNTTGNAATATALASAPTQCTGVQAAQGVDVHGNANCYTPSGAGGSNLCGTSISTSTLTLENTASSGSPCIYGINSTGTLFSFTSSPTVVIAGAPTGNGTFTCYVNSSGQEECQISTAAGGTYTCTAVNCLTVSSPSFPAGSLPKAQGTLTASSGNWTTLAIKTPTAGNWTNLTGGNGLNFSNGVGSIDSTVPQKGATNSWTGANDFTAAASTAPAKSGASNPATCTVAQQFFNTAATAGSNLYLCTATNTWTQVTGGGGGTTTTTETIDAPSSGCNSSGSPTSIWTPNYAGTAPSSTCSLGGAGIISSLNFNAVNAQAIFSWKIPQGWTSGTVGLTVEQQTWFGSGTLSYTLETACPASGTDLNSITWNATQTISAVMAFGLQRLTQAALTMTGCSAGNTQYVRVTRTDTNGNQNYVIRATMLVPRTL